MTTSTINAVAASIVSIKGRGKAERSNAYLRIAPLAFVETQSRDETVQVIRTALGKSPTVDEVKAAQREYVIGRAAARMPAGEFPKGTSDNADKLEHARKLVTSYAAPTEAGRKEVKLRKGQEGRRTAVQHKVIRAAESAWSMIIAEVGFGTAKTLKEKTATQAANKKAAGAPSMAGSGKGKKSAAPAPSHTELVKPAVPVTVEEAHATMIQMAKTMMQFGKKHGALLSASFGKIANATHKALLDADIERRAIIATKDAIAAEADKLN